MPQFLHNPSLILNDSIKQLNLQLSIWIYLPHSSYVLSLLHILPAFPFFFFPCPLLHPLTLNRTCFTFFAMSASSSSLCLTGCVYAKSFSESHEINRLKAIRKKRKKGKCHTPSRCIQLFYEQGHNCTVHYFIVNAFSYKRIRLFSSRGQCRHCT